MPGIDDIPANLEKSQLPGPDGWWIRMSDFGGGQGMRWGKEQRLYQPLEQRKFWFSRLDTFFPGQYTLPLLSTDSNPSGISASESDYAAIGEFWDFDTPQRIMLMAKGTKMYSATAATWTNRATVTSAQGQQIYQTQTAIAIATGGFIPRIIWPCGVAAVAQCSTDGVSWQDFEVWNPDTLDIYAHCVWDFEDTTGYTGVAWIGGVVADGDGPPAITNAIYLQTESGGAQAVDSGRLGIVSSAPPFLVGQEGTSGRAIVANGDRLLALTPDDGTLEVVDHILPFTIKCGCKYTDEFAISPGDYRIFSWRWDRPLRDISPWGLDGCPSDLAGKVVGLYGYGKYLICHWELNAGGSLILWYNPEQGGSWHIRSVTLPGEHAEGNQSLAMSTELITNTHRLWAVTADGSDAYAYYQDHPIGLNPLNATTTHAPGYLYLYTSWYDLVLLGDYAAAMQFIERNADLSSVLVMTVDYRLNYDSETEESGSADWKSILTFNDQRRRVQIAGGGTVQGISVQFRIGMNDTDVGDDTPTGRDLGVYVKREGRKPSLMTT